MADVLQVVKADTTVDAREQAPLTAVGTAAVAAAEAIAAKVAAELATEAAARAAQDVVAACAAAVRAAVTASSTATAAVSAAAEAAAETAMQNALDAEVDVDSKTATAVASVAFSLAVVDSCTLGDEAAAPLWDAGTAEAIVISAAAAAMAAAHVAMTISAAAAAAAIAAIDAAALMAAQLHQHEQLHVAQAADELRTAIASHAADIASAVLQVDRQPAPGVHAAAAAGDRGAPAPEPAPGRQEAGRPEWVSMLADPLLPAFQTDAAEWTEAMYDAPRERGLLRDLSLARRMASAVRDDEAGFEAAFDAAPVGLLIARVDDGRPAEVVHVNAAMCRITGRPAIQLLADGCRRLSRGDLGVPAPRGSTGGRSGREQSEGQVQRWVHADGAEVLVRVRTATTGTSTGGVQHLVCHIEPVTTPGS